VYSDTVKRRESKKTEAIAQRTIDHRSGLAEFTKTEAIYLNEHVQNHLSAIEPDEKDSKVSFPDIMVRDSS